MNRKLKIGLIGLGCIGQGVIELILQNHDIIKKKTGVDMELVMVCDINKTETHGIEYTKDYDDVLDSDVDVVIELVGGTTIAKEIVVGALKKKKHVVTANKALLAKFGKELIGIANENGVQLNYEASVAGGIPIIEAIKNSLVQNNIKSIYGILNGTCNYILTRMMKDLLPFDVALKEAQKKGFAEADPTLDINGGDSAHKVIILTYSAFGKFIGIDDMIVEGIENVTPMDQEIAEEMGYVIKLLGIIKEKDGKLDVRVHPAMVHKEHLLASVDNELNALFVEGDFLGPALFYGKGAGSRPTASAVVSDVIKVVKQPEYSSIFETDIDLKDRDDIRSRYYLKFELREDPGTLAQVAKVLGEHDISISGVIQKEREKKFVPVIFLTHMATEKNVQESLLQIEKLDCVKNNPKLMRIID